MSIVRIVDFETTGTEPPEAQVCEYAYCDLMQTGAGWEVGAPVSRLCDVPSIPPEVRAVHHITMAEIEASGQPHFDPAEVQNPDRAVTAFAAHNAAFEAKFVGDFGLPLICTYKAALRAWPDAPSHSNGALRYWLEDQGKLSLDPALAQPAHRAGPDAYVTAHILKALLDEGFTGREMTGWTKQPPVQPRCMIGDWRGKPWAEVDVGFLRWMVNKPVEPDHVWNAQRELDRRREAGL